MEIIHGEDSLKHFLCSIKNSKITLVTAFAIKTQAIVDTLLRNGNQVVLVVGTINYFTDPVFLDHCRSLASQDASRLALWVDFRGQDSIHWKLYLVEPDTVVIGSPNLTTIGLSMKRDTAVQLQNTKLYQDYQSLLAELKRQERVLASTHPRFVRELDVYREAHRWRIARVIVDTPPVSDFLEWFRQDETQVLPLFMWESGFSREDMEDFKTNVEPVIREEHEALGLSGTPKFAKVGWSAASGRKKPYEEGSLVLKMKCDGDQATFVPVDRVIFSNGRWWLIRNKNKRRPGPFTLTPELKAIIKRKAEEWYADGKTILDSNDLGELADALRAGRGRN